MRTKQIVGGLAAYAVMATGQALISYAINQGITRAGLAMDERRRKKRRVGFL